MKNIGIVADNYKVDRFKKELRDTGFTDFIVKPLSNDVLVIQVKVKDYEVSVIKKICQRVELHFKNSN